MKLFHINWGVVFTFLIYKNFQLACAKWYQSIRLGANSESENQFRNNRTSGLEITNVFSQILCKFQNFHRVRPFLTKFTEKTSRAWELRFTGRIATSGVYNQTPLVFWNFALKPRQNFLKFFFSNFRERVKLSRRTLNKVPRLGFWNVQGLKPHLSSTPQCSFFWSNVTRQYRYKRLKLVKFSKFHGPSYLIFFFLF